MGLDATVYCDCLERGQLRTQPPPTWNVYVDEYGARAARTGNLEAEIAFDKCNADACDHENGVLLHHWLGNIGGISLLRGTLSEFSACFPILLSKVIYSGTHCGDQLPIHQLDQAATEVQALSLVTTKEPLAERRLRDFEKKMADLIAVARSVRKPISF